MKIRIASFDVGKKNFAQYIEDIQSETVDSLKEKYNSLDKKDKRRVKGPMNDGIRSILTDLSINATRIQTGVYDFTTEDTTSLDVETRKNMFEHMKRYKELWDQCDIFIIEQQYFKTWSGGRGGTEANVDAIKLGEGLLSWLLINYPTKIIKTFGSQNKTLMLGAPAGMGKAERKKWAVQKTRKLYEARKDEPMNHLFKLCDSVYRKRVDTEERVNKYLKEYPTEFDNDCQTLAEMIVKNKQKLDDVSDACLQCQAFKFKTMVACF